MNTAELNCSTILIAQPYRIDLRRVLYFLCAFTVPFQIANVVLLERFSLPLPILLSMLDPYSLRDWSKAVVNRILWRPTRMYLLCACFAITVFLLRGLSPLLFIKVLFSLYFVYYFQSGVSKYGFKPLVYAVATVCGFGVLQFIEAWVFGTSLLDSRRIYLKLGNLLLIGNSGSLGYSYAFGFGGVPRVSSFAAEPGFFSSMLMAYIPLAFLSRHLRWIIPVGLLVSFSKVTLVGLPAIALAFIWVAIFKRVWPLVLVLPPLEFLAVPFFVSNVSLLAESSPSSYFRILPAFVWHEYGLKEKLLGSSDPCSVTSPHFVQIGEYASVGYRSIDGSCLISDALSFYGSMLASIGVVGAAIFILIIWKLGNLSNTRSHHSQILSRFFLVCVCYAFLSSNFFAFNVSLLSCVSLSIWCASKTRLVSYEAVGHRSSQLRV